MSATAIAIAIARPAESAPPWLADLTFFVQDKIESGKVPVPLLPQVAMQLVQASGDETQSAARLAALVHRDPALAGQILRIANSPAYCASATIVSLQQAVARLGLSVLREIALAASFKSGVFVVPGFETQLQTMWRHSLGTATFAKEVARARRLNVESAYLCGLLHRVGDPVVLQLTVSQLQKDRIKFGDEEKDALSVLASTLGGQAGAQIATAWKLPSAVVASVAYHANPQAAPDHKDDVTIVAVASALASALLKTPEDESETPEQKAAFADTLIKHPGFAALNIYKDEAAKIVNKAQTVQKAVAAQMS